MNTKRLAILSAAVMLLVASLLVYGAIVAPEAAEADYTWNIEIVSSSTTTTLLHKSGANCDSLGERVWIKATSGYCPPEGEWVLAIDIWQGGGYKYVDWADLGITVEEGDTCCMYWKCPNANPPPPYLWGNDHATVTDPEPRPTATP